MNKSIWQCAYQYQVWRYDNNVSGRIHQLRTFTVCCLYIYVVEQHRCSSDCFFFHFVAQAGVSRQTWRLAQLLGKYSMCIVLGPFQKGIKAKRKSATNPPQWIHIPLLCFFVWFVFGLYCCFFVAAFILVAEAQRLIPSTGEQQYWPTICLESLKLPYIYITPYSECNFHILCGGNPEMSFGIYVP